MRSLRLSCVHCRITAAWYGVLVHLFLVISRCGIGIYLMAFWKVRWIIPIRRLFPSDACAQAGTFLWHVNSWSATGLMSQLRAEQWGAFRVRMPRFRYCTCTKIRTSAGPYVVGVLAACSSASGVSEAAIAVPTHCKAPTDSAPKLHYSGRWPISGCPKSAWPQSLKKQHPPLSNHSQSMQWSPLF